MRCSISRILALATESRVVVFFSRRHRQDGFHRDKGTICVLLLGRLDVLVQDVAQTVDPRNLKAEVEPRLYISGSNAREAAVFCENDGNNRVTVTSF